MTQLTARRQAGYYGLRASAAALITSGLTLSLHLEYGIWMLIAALLVIQPVNRDALARGKLRILGTMIGALTATLAVLVLPFNAVTTGLVAGLTGVLCGLVPHLREMMPLAAITASIVFLLDGKHGELTNGMWRCVLIFSGVIIGVGLSLVRLPGEAREKRPGKGKEIEGLRE